MSIAPSALLLIASGCPHCPSVLQSLTELIKEGKIARLEVVNIEQDPDRAKALNVRSVPWMKLGEFELAGLKSKTEILQWIEKSASPENMSAYFEELMNDGDISKVQQLVIDNPQYMNSLFDIMSNESSSLSARIGVGVIIEHLEGSDILINHIDSLGEICQNPLARIRNDACYYLGLTHHQDARKYIRPLLDDSDEEVKEIAREALDEIVN
jgi:thiol-disulfide isomerase/thioredoxin